MQTLEKRTWESIKFDIDMSRLLASGETITGTPTMVVTPDTSPAAITFGVPVVNSSPTVYAYATAPTGTVVQVTIGGGVDETTYTVRARCATSLGNSVEGTVALLVRDRP